MTPTCIEPPNFPASCAHLDLPRRSHQVILVHKVIGEVRRDDSVKFGAERSQSTGVGGGECLDQLDEWTGGAFHSAAKMGEAQCRSSIVARSNLMASTAVPRRCSITSGSPQSIGGATGMEGGGE